MKKLLLIVIIFLAVTNTAWTQKIEPIIVNATIVEGDTIPIIRLSEVEIFSLTIPDSRKSKKKTSKTY